MNFQKILWPTDLSANSLKAGNHVISLAEKYNAEVILMYVAVDLCNMFPAYGNYPSQEHLNNFRDWEVEKARKQLQQICDEELTACPFLKIRLVMGDPAEEIMKMAEKEKVDLIVLTRRGQGLKDQNDTQMGTIAEKVVKSARIPVHVVQP